MPMRIKNYNNNTNVNNYFIEKNIHLRLMFIQILTYRDDFSFNYLRIIDTYSKC